MSIRKTRRTRAQAAHDAAARRTAKLGWIVQHSHPARHLLRGLMSIGRSAKSLGSKTSAVSRLLRVDLVTARMIAEDAPNVQKPRGPAADRVAEAERIEGMRARGEGFFVAPRLSRREVQAGHRAAAKARSREAVSR